MPDIFLYQGEANPNDILLSDPTVQRGGGSSVNYTLVCASGSYVYTGQAATLVAGRKLALAVGAYAYTGQSATPTVARRLSLAAGAYAYAGQAAALAVARRMALDTGAYAYTGNAATLAYAPGVVAYTLACNAGAYVYAGNDASLTYRAGAARPLGGHFGFDEKKRNKRWKKERDEQEERREVLVSAFQGLPADVKPVAVEAITGTASVSIDWEPIIVDTERFHAAIMQMAIAKAARQDEDDISELIELGVL